MSTSPYALRLASLLGLLAACGPTQPGETQGSSGDTTAEPGTGSEGPTTGTPTTGTPTTDDPQTNTNSDPATSTLGETSDTVGTITDPTTSADDTTEDVPPPAFCPPGPTPRRRLTNTQYLNSLRDLFPGVQLTELELPPDRLVEGFDNIAESQDPEPSPLYVSAAELTAAVVVAAGAPVLGCPADGGADPTACGHAFLSDLAPRAFRRPLDAADLQQRLGAFDAALAADGFSKALAAAIVGLLADDAFLHLQEPGGAPVDGQPGVLKLDGFAVASRMSYFLWNTTPDAELLAAAGDGGLDDLAGIDAQATRLLADPRARDAIAHLHEQWLFLHHLSNSDSEQPFNLRLSMREEMRRLLQSVVFDGGKTLASLLTTPTAFIDDALAEIYEVADPPEPFTAVELDPERRTGILTRAGWLTIGSRKAAHSPFTRGWRLLDSLFCMQLPPPPPDVVIEPIDVPPDATTRELYDTILAEPACAGCHVAAHRVGYGFEHYAALGAWQDVENGKEIDASAEIVAELGSDVPGPFASTAALAEQLAGSRTVHDCTTRKHYMYSLGRGLVEADACGLEALQIEFFAGGGDIQALLRAIVRSDGFRHRLAP